MALWGCGGGEETMGTISFQENKCAWKQLENNFLPALPVRSAPCSISRGIELLKSLVQGYKPVAIWHHSTFTNLIQSWTKVVKVFTFLQSALLRGHSTGENTRQETQLVNLGYETAPSHEVTILPAHLSHLVLHYILSNNPESFPHMFIMGTNNSLK